MIDFKFVDQLQSNLKLLKTYDVTMNADFEEILAIWIETFEFRKKTLDRNENHDIIKEWPILHHPEAYRLVILL